MLGSWEGVTGERDKPNLPGETPKLPTGRKAGPSCYGAHLMHRFVCVHLACTIYGTSVRAYKPHRDMPGRKKAP